MDKVYETAKNGIELFVNIRDGKFESSFLSEHGMKQHLRNSNIKITKTHSIEELVKIQERHKKEDK